MTDALPEPVDVRGAALALLPDLPARASPEDQSVTVSARAPLGA